MRKTSGQAVAGIAAAARPSGAAGSTARLTAALAATLGVAAACWVITIRLMTVIPVLVTAHKLLPERAALDVPLALAIVALGVVIIVDPSPFPGQRPRCDTSSRAALPGCCDHKKRRNKAMTSHKIGTREEWAAAREELLAREKEHIRLGDELARQRRELPRVRVEKEYRFDTDDGPRTLAELFDGRSQLLVYHFMFGPSYAAGCPTCSSIADSVNGVLPHLNARDVTMLFVSQAPLDTLHAFKRRMGWSFPWVSSASSEFNIDLGFSSSQEQTREWAAPMLEQLPPIAARNARETGTDIVGYLTETFGFSVFVLDDGAVYQTYSAGGRGVEFLMGYYPILDRAPKGRDEGDGFQLWIRRHDEYDSQ